MKRLSLFLRIVWRESWTGDLLSVRDAWLVAGIIHGEQP